MTMWLVSEAYPDSTPPALFPRSGKALSSVSISEVWHWMVYAPTGEEAIAIVERQKAEQQISEPRNRQHIWAERVGEDAVLLDNRGFIGVNAVEEMKRQA